jgi:hypothetical protein
MPANIRVHPKKPLKERVSFSISQPPTGGEHRLETEQNGGMGWMGIFLGDHLEGVSDAHRCQPAIKNRHGCLQIRWPTVLFQQRMPSTGSGWSRSQTG